MKTIKNFISADSVTNSHRFIKAIREKITVLKKHPEPGRPVFPEKYKQLRQLLYKSYRIIYQFSDDEIRIVSVHHQSRLVENITTIKDYKK